MPAAPPEITDLFVGRDAELASLSWALERTGRGSGRVVLLAGEPGVGKTRLAEQFAELAAQGGTEVHWGRCWEWGGAPALWPWLQLIRSLCSRADEAEWSEPVTTALRDAHGLLAANGGSDAAQGPRVQFALLDRVCEALALASCGVRIALFIDDLHAADAASIHLLRFLARDTRKARLLVVATCRDAEMQCSDEVAGLLGAIERDATRLHVTGLRAAAVRVLAEQLTGEQLPDAAVARLVEATGGNALYLSGMLRAAASSGGVAHMNLEGQALPHDLRGAIERRLSALDAQDLHVLSVIAAVGHEASPAMIRHVTGLDDASVDRALQHALGESLLRESTTPGGRFRLAHSLMADVVYQQLPLEQRARMHGVIGDYLESAGGSEGELPAAELARHFLNAGAGYRRRGAGHARSAAKQAFAVCAYDQAAELHERVLEVLALEAETDQVAVSELLLELAEARRLAGRTQAARAANRRAAQLDANLRCFAEASLGMARTSEFATEDQETLGLLETALLRAESTEAATGPEGDALRVRLLSALATLLWISPHARQRRLGLAEQARTLAARLDDPYARAGALMAQLQADWHPDVLAERLAWTDELRHVAESLDDPALRFEALRWRLNALWEQGHIAAANATLDAYEALAARMKWPQAQLNAAVRRAVQAEIAGDIEGVQTSIESIRQWGARAGDPQTSIHTVTAQATAHWLRGDLEAMAEIEPELRRVVRYFHMLPAADTVALAFGLALGDQSETRRQYEHYASANFENVAQGFGTVCAYCRLAEACGHFEDRARAGTLHSLLAPYADQLAVAGPSTCAGSPLRHLGQLSLLLGETARGIDELERSVEAHRRMGARSWEARSISELAVALQQRGHGDDSRRAGELRSEALAVAEQHGFTGIARDLRGERASPPSAPARGVLATGELRQEGDVWTVRFSGNGVRVKDSRGLHHLKKLLERPGQELHALELSADDPQHARGLDSDAGEVLDDQAAQAYRSRVEDLRDDISEAERWNDSARAEELRQELEFIASQLAEGLGLAGRSRRSGSTAERARAAVTRAIRRTLSRLASDLPELGQHLERSIRTGVYCCYDPDPTARITWLL